MKLTDKKPSLRVYLSLAFLIFSLVLIIIMWLFQSVFFDAFYRTVKTVQVERCADSISKNIEDEDLKSVIKETEEQNDMDISVYSVSEFMAANILTPVYAPHEFISTHSLINMSSVQKYYQKAEANGGKITEKSDSKLSLSPNKPNKITPPLEKESSQLLTCAIITDTEDAQYLVIVESDIAPVTSTVETLRVQLIIMTGFILLISIFIAVITSHYVSKPIHETTKKAKLLAQQNYDLTFSGGNYKELCELNDTLTFSAHELQKVDELRRELISNISHDLRTPLTMITGYSEVMRDIPGENNPENVQIIIDEANRLAQLVNDLLDISKLESGATAMQNTTLCLTDCIKDIFKRYTKLTEQEGYNIVFNYTEDAYIYADELRISQVLYNLINNAINYVGEDKTVIVNQTVRDSTVYIEVIDHGVGIEEENLPYIWDRYYKVDKEHKQAVVGTGLGLSIVKNILNHYDAQYGVKSSVGEGSTFWFSMKTIEKQKNP
ncbi:MAG: HAMP domain-containing histidine kinase [Ruminococcus sp.]|nr:HAMP domain-containing histidine kinase [Ruminococcus sp.]